MEESTRRAIVYIAGRLITEKNLNAIYDINKGKWINFIGNVSADKVNIYDYNLSQFITGNRSEKGLSLYHYGNSKFTSLEINGSDFKGYDFDSSKFYSGKVNENSINIYDCETLSWCNYSI